MRAGLWVAAVMATAYAGQNESEWTATMNEAGWTEEKCEEDLRSIYQGLLALAIVPPAINVINSALILFLIFRILRVRADQEEDFNSTMLLTRTALRVTIPIRAQDAIMEVIGLDIKQALATRLSPENAAKFRRENRERADWLKTPEGNRHLEEEKEKEKKVGERMEAEARQRVLEWEAREAKMTPEELEEERKPKPCSQKHKEKELQRKEFMRKRKEPFEKKTE